MHRLEHGQLIAEVSAGGDAQAADEPGAEVGQYVTVEVGQHQHVVQLRLLDKLHRHVVHQHLLVGDLRILFRHPAGHGEEQAVRELHDVVLGHGGHLLASEPAGVLEGEAYYALAAVLGDDLEGEAGVITDRAQVSGVRDLRYLGDRRIASLKLHPRV